MELLTLTAQFEWILGKSNYWASTVLLLIGLHAMISKNNLIKKLIGMSIFQTGIILFYVSAGAKHGAQIPIVHYGHDSHESHDKAAHAAEHAADAGQQVAEAAAPAANHAADATHTLGETLYANPLPHVLMLTAIVVGVATLGLALAMVQKVYAAYGSIEEDEVLDAIADSTADSTADNTVDSTVDRTVKGTPEA